MAELTGILNQGIAMPWLRAAETSFMLLPMNSWQLLPSKRQAPSQIQWHLS